MSYYIIASALVVIGFSICLFLIFRGKRKARAIQHYENTRDKLTIREPEEDDEGFDATNATSEGILGLGLGNLVGGFVVILVGINIIPVVQDAIIESQINVSMSSASSSILDLTTVFFILGIIAAGISLAIGGLRNGGLV